MAEAPLVSVVVTVRNAQRTLPATLETLRRLTWPADRLELVVVDAFSTDGTWETLQRLRDEAPGAPFQVVLDQAAGGIGAGRNRAFALARGEFVAVTDADMRVPPDWIERLMAGMEEGIGVVGGPNDGVQDERVQRCTNAIPVHGPSLREVPVLGRSRYRADYATDTDVFAAVTRNCLFRRAAFDAAGGFDESLVTTEDGELNRRILDAGYRIRYCRDAGVVHTHRDTLGRFFRQMRNYARGQAQANQRHPSMRRVRHRLPGTALALWLLSLVAAAVEPAFWPLPLLLAGLALGAALGYTAKAAAVRRDAGLLLCLPVFFLAWQLAWAIGYAEGALGAGRGGSHAGA